MEFEDRVLFSVFRLPVTGYAVCVALAAACGLGLFFILGNRKKLSPDAVWRTALLALPLGLLGARVFYCAARVSLYQEIGMEAMLYLWEGGYALWGAVGGVVLAALIAAKSCGQPIAPLLDALAAPGALTIALARFAEYFSGEGMGLYVEEAFFQRFPFAVYDGYYEEWKWAVFILEGLAALAILGALLKKRKAGDTARLFLLLYSACQILLESLRRDGCLRWLFVRVSQLTAAIVVVLLMAAAAVRWTRRKEERRMSGKGLAARWAAVAASVGLIIALEFAADDKIWHALPIWGVYGLMACGCFVIGVSAWQTVFRSLKTE